MRPGEWQFWRIGHFGATEFVRLRIAGMALIVVATDGHALARPRRVDELFLGPGQRVEAIAIGPAAGDYALATVPFQNEAWNPPTPARRLATLRSRGAGSPSDAAEAALLGLMVDDPDHLIGEVRRASITSRRNLGVSHTDDRPSLL